jgi:NADPH2:quinone reductase
MEVGEEHGLPLHRYPLEQTAAAHAVESGVVGKVVIDVAPIRRSLITAIPAGRM